MSLYIHVGQCGNQLALPFWKLAESEVPKSKEGEVPNSNTLFDDLDGYSRAIFIDSEPKVVAKTCKHLTRVRPSNVVLESSGCGNNWSMGFSSCFELENKHNKAQFLIDEKPNGIFSSSVEAIRRESERFDRLRSLVMIHSIGGGTSLSHFTRDLYLSHLITCEYRHGVRNGISFASTFKVLLFTINTLHFFLNIQNINIFFKFKFLYLCVFVLQG